jgi:hypothetical protein
MSHDYEDEPSREPSGAPQTSGKAVGSLVLGISSLLCTCFTAVPALILAIMALSEIGKSGGRRTGKGLAIGGLVLSILGLTLTPLMLVPILIGLLLPAVQKTREAAARIQTSNNLKEVGIGMQNFEGAYQQFPSATVYDANGKPLYSWRVLLLPHIGEDLLYRQFHLDEPWDSPNNLPLLKQMPKAYQTPADPDANAAGNTYFQVFNGPGAMFDSDTRFGLRPSIAGPTTRQGNRDGGPLVGVTDGTSNTFMVAEAATAVPWTAPRDIPFDPAKPLPPLGGRFPRVFLVLFADGSVRSVDRKTPEATLKLYIQKADGMALPDL